MGKLIALIGILVVILAIVGGFIYFNNQKLGGIAAPQKVSAFDDLKNELDSIDVGAKESDLNEVDKDLQGL